MVARQGRSSSVLVPAGCFVCLGQGVKKTKNVVQIGQAHLMALVLAGGFVCSCHGCRAVFQVLEDPAPDVGVSTSVERRLTHGTKKKATQAGGPA